MDPTTTLGEIRELIDHGELDDALVERVQGLDEWLSKGGFLPEQWRSSRISGRPRRQVDGPRLEGVPHGRRGSYNKGCKCVPCTAANRLGRNLTEQEVEELTNANTPAEA